MKKMMFVFMMIGLFGCGQGDTGIQGPVGPMGSPGPVGPEVGQNTDRNVQELIDDENFYREGLGQTELSQGLSCSVQLVGSGQWLASSSPGYNASQGVVTALAGSTSYTYLFTGSFNQVDTASGSNTLLPTQVEPLFVGQNYKINCSGQVVVTQSGYYGFDLNSDDGSILTVDGSQVINNDGNHSMTDKSGTKYLREGVHTFNLLYAQSGGGNFGLVLQWNNKTVPGNVWYH